MKTVSSPLSSSTWLFALICQVVLLSGAETDRVLISSGQGYFPVASRLQDGRIAVVFRGGASHVGIGGRLDMVYSSDEGRTWSKPAVVIDSPLDDRNPAFGQAHDGSLIVAYWECSYYDDKGRYIPDASKSTRTLVTRSNDGGKTWSDPQPIDFSGLKIGSPYGRIVLLPDKSLLMNIYGTPVGHARDGSFVFRSTDAGRSWIRYATMATNGFNETSLVVLTNHSVLAALRHEKRAGPEGENLWLSRSDDAGRTWSTPRSLTPDKVHPADLVLNAAGEVVLLAGDRRGPFGVLALQGDSAGNLTWAGPRTLVSDCVNWDCGYPSGVLVAGGKLLTVYYGTGNTNHPDWGVHSAGVIHSAK